jgi:hypothetical protein
MPVSPFDPAEALTAAAAEHPCCPEYAVPDPKNITEQTTLAELAAQRALLGISSLTLMADNNGQRTAIVQHPMGGLHTGQGETEAAAIEAAFSSLRVALLPTPLKALFDEATGDSGRPLLEGCWGCGHARADHPNDSGCQFWHDGPT